MMMEILQTMMAAAQIARLRKDTNAQSLVVLISKLNHELSMWNLKMTDIN